MRRGSECRRVVGRPRERRQSERGRAFATCGFPGRSSSARAYTERVTESPKSWRGTFGPAVGSEYER